MASVTISAEAMAAVKAEAKLKGEKVDETASKLVLTGSSKLEAVRRYAKENRKKGKVTKRKAKAKSASKAAKKSVKRAPKAKVKAAPKKNTKAKKARRAKAKASSPKPSKPSKVKVPRPKKESTANGASTTVDESTSSSDLTAA